jgi:hypothetical protein
MKDSKLGERHDQICIYGHIEISDLVKVGENRIFRDIMGKKQRWGEI